MSTLHHHSEELTVLEWKQPSYRCAALHSSNYTLERPTRRMSTSNLAGKKRKDRQTTLSNFFAKKAVHHHEASPVESISSEVRSVSPEVMDDVSSSLNPEVVEVAEEEPEETIRETPEEMTRQKYQTTQNVAHRWVQQSTTGRRMPRVLARHWSTSSVEFSATCQTVTHLAFDKGGVLLAVAMANSSIAIYDWDSLEAANLKGRAQKKKTTLEPVIQFRLPLYEGRSFAAISFLQWSPFHEDVLAVGNR